MIMKTTAKYTDDELRTIESLACASPATPAHREYAIDAHRALMARVRSSKARLPYGDMHFEFMREVDTPMPDLGLRATYRARIIKAMQPT